MSKIQQIQICHLLTSQLPFLRLKKDSDLFITLPYPPHTITNTSSSLQHSDRVHNGNRHRYVTPMLLVGNKTPCYCAATCLRLISKHNGDVCGVTQSVKLLTLRPVFKTNKESRVVPRTYLL